MKKIVYIFTDGACRGNPGPGGWGALLRYDSHEKIIYGAESFTTNNRMELTAVINALAALNQPCEIEITTDSNYVRLGITQWVLKWKSNNWRNSDKKEVKNKDLWEKLDLEVRRHKKVIWHWVKGHSGHPENDIADQLANRGIDELLAE
jgi:ribonuclease HI